MNENELDKMSDDLYKDLMGKKASWRRPDNYADRFEDLIEDIRKGGGNVPDNWKDMINGFADQFDDMIVSDMDDMYLYDFEFDYMSSLAETDWIDESSRDVCLGDVTQVLANAEERGVDIYKIDPEEFKITHSKKDGLDIFFYEFPSYPKSPFAMYGVIIFGEKGGRYYTLEFERPGLYMICSPSSQMHSNYGVAKNTSKEGFLKKAIALYKA